MHPGRPPVGGSGGLSAEQQRRMEENRRKAQAKLAAKRAASSNPQPESKMQAPPPAKRPAYATPAASTSSFPSYDNARYHPNSTEAGPSRFSASKSVNRSAATSSHTTNTQGPHPVSSDHTKIFNTGNKTLQSDFPSPLPITAVPQKPPFYSKSYPSHLPISSSSSHNKATAPNSTTTSKETRPPPFYSKPPKNSSSQSTSAPNAFTKLLSASASQKPSPSLPPTNHPPPVKYTQLQEMKKARVYMVSRARCEVCVQYDHDLIEIFKKMPTRAYSESR